MKIVNLLTAAAEFKIRRFEQILELISIIRQLSAAEYCRLLAAAVC